jgi:tetratricopeptide (TPR) repeat protein
VAFPASAETQAAVSRASSCSGGAELAAFESLPNAAQACLLAERGMQANFEGRYSDAEATWKTLRELTPRSGAAALGEIDTAWWRLMLAGPAPRNDATILRASEEAIALAEARLAQDPADIEALYEKGAALFNRARLHGLRGRYLKAGREGEQGRKLLERVIELDPDRTDSRYSLGLYTYYTDVAPDLVRWMSWLWFVPKGDRESGLRNLEIVRASGGLHAPGAAFILMNVNTYHAPMDLPGALATGRALHARYPGNALFHSELVEVMLKMGLYEEAIETALSLEASEPSEAEARVRPQLARILRAQAVLLSGRTEEAWEILEPMEAEHSALPIWGGAWLHLVRGQVHDARGERAAAQQQYRRVLALEGPRFNPRAALIAEAGLEAPFQAAEYRELPMVSAGR